MKLIAFFLGCWGITLSLAYFLSEKSWTLTLDSLYSSRFMTQIVLGTMILFIAGCLLGWSFFSKEN